MATNGLILQVNGSPLALENPVSVEELLVHVGLSDRPCAVEVNRSLVPKREHTAHELTDGDQIEIVTLVGGG